MKENIIDTYTSYFRKMVHNNACMILEKYYIKDIIECFIDNYISYAFYDFYAPDSKIKNVNIYKNFEDLKNHMNKETLYYKDEIEVNYKMFLYAKNLIEMKEYDSNLVNEIIMYKNSLIKEDKDKNKIIQEDIKSAFERKEKFFLSFKTDDFYLEYEKTNVKKLYNVTLEYNIKFPEIYSTFAINKAYQRDLVNEQKIFVYYYMLTFNILNDTIYCNTNKYYLVDFDYTIFEKEQKIKRLFKIIDNDLIKDRLIFKVTYKDYKNNEINIKNMIKNGYKIAVIIDNEFTINDKILLQLDMFYYIIINDDKLNFKELKDKTNIVTY